MSTASNLTVCSTPTECSFDGVARLCFKDVYWSNKTNFCDCSSFFGFYGENCDQAGPTVMYLKFVHFLTLLWTTIYLGRIASRVSQCKDLVCLDTERFHCHSPTRTVTLLFMLFCGFMALFLSAALRLPSFFDPSRFVVVKYEPFGDHLEFIMTQHGELSAILLGATPILATLITLEICCFWLSVVESSPFSLPTLRRPHFRRGASLLTFMLLLVAVVFLSEALYHGLFFLFSVLTLVLLVVRCVSGHRIISLFASAKAQKVLKIVRKATIAGTICLSLTLVLSIMYYSLLTTYLKFTSPGSFNFTLLARDARTFVTLVQFSITYKYLENYLNRQHHNLKSTKTFLVRAVITRQEETQELPPDKNCKPSVHTSDEEYSI